ncbi:Testis-expressed sequence 11 protein [Acipenser ruthenus]|uniref:Testis-expressed sequence 11 protein n=1 Tax=Acipenser ruthenus TaxID=7906 RepID=A0A444UUF2_ACIRT|nr:Testis-expressed sequence 11 protein [Acipenser ruthenus]
MDMEGCLSKIKELSQELVQKQIPGNVEEIIDKLFSKVSCLVDKLFSENLELLYGRLKTRSDGQSDLNIPKGDVEKDLFRVHSYQAESAVAQADHQQAVSYVQRCKDMLLRLPKETGYLSLMCYNFGVDTYNLKKYEESSFWLSQSYDIGKMHKKYSPGASVQAKILRLLANVYMEWDSIAELLDVEVPLDVCLNTVNLLMDADREVLAFEFLKSVCKHFEASPELGRAQVQHIKMLLQRGKELLGKQKIEDIITGHYTGKQLSPEALNHLHLLLWDRAAKNFEARNYSEAVQWYNYSLSFYSAGQMEQNLAKLQRNRASCFLHLQQLDKNDQQDAAMKALEYLCQQSQDSGQVFIALRCLVRLVLSKMGTITEEKSNLNYFAGDFSKDPTDTLLLLYEFEARAKLNDPKLETVLESVMELQQIETKTLETIASLAMEPPAHFPSLCKKALRIALSLHRKRPDSDILRCSQCLHSLIQLSLPTGVLEVESRVLEEVWGYYEEALLIISSAHGEFPEVEILWLLTRAWNTGILLYSLAPYTEAEKWCGLGMSFLRHLGSLQASYETQMSGLYTEVLDRLDKAKTNLVTEA